MDNEIIMPGFVPKGAKSKYIRHNKRFPKGSFILWSFHEKLGWEYGVFDNLQAAIEVGSKSRIKEWAVMQACDYSQVENQSAMRKAL